MLVRHLVVGVVIGAEVALGSGLAGASAWAIVGFYVLGANLGLGLSVASALVPPRQGAARTAALVRRASRPASGLPLAE